MADATNSTVFDEVTTNPEVANDLTVCNMEPESNSGLSGLVVYAAGAATAVAIGGAVKLGKYIHKKIKAKKEGNVIDVETEEIMNAPVEEEEIVIEPETDEVKTEQPKKTSKKK